MHEQLVGHWLWTGSHCGHVLSEPSPGTFLVDWVDEGYRSLHALDAMDGWMFFTSRRAMRAWADSVAEEEEERRAAGAALFRKLFGLNPTAEAAKDA